MLLLFLCTLVGQQSHWKAPFETVKQPEGYSGFEHRLDSNGTGIFVRNGRLTFLSKGKENKLSLPDWLRLPFVHDEKDNVWVAQATMDDFDRAFFTYGLKDGGALTRRVYRAANAPKAPASAEKLKGSLQTFHFPSKQIEEVRDVIVYIPPNPGPELNAIYMADGQACESFARVLEPLILAKRVAPTAIVGIACGAYKGDPAHYDMEQDFRAREYLKVADPDRFESHLRFVVDEVIPWAEVKFGIQSGAAHRALFGFSNGGAFALVAASERPDVFGVAMPFSIAVFDRKAMKTTTTEKSLPVYWISAGALEVFNENSHDAEQILRESRAQVHFDEYISGHDDAMWQLAFARDLPLIFPGKK